MMHVYLMHVSMIHTYGAYIIDAYGGTPGVTLSMTEEEKKKEKKNCNRGF